VAGEYLAQTLERNLPEVTIARRPGLATPSQTSQSLLSREIDLAVEYSGTALMDLFGQEPGGTPEEQRERVREGFRSRLKCEWIGPLGFENPPVLSIPAGMASKEGIRTLSDAEARAGGWTLGMGTDFAESGDGVALLLRRYRLRPSGPFRTAEGGRVYEEMRKGAFTMAAGRALDSALAKGDATALADDRKAWPAYEAGIVVRIETLERMPRLAGVLRSYEGQLSRTSMAEMVGVVEDGERAAEVVVHEMLAKGGH
jgi:glycine betaine/choline ABC-type transport system substrate-binding protein